MIKNNLKISYTIIALLLLSFCEVLLLGMRFLLSGGLFDMEALLWNIFLAWVPIFFAYAFDKSLKITNRLFQLFLFSGWLLFFPNAPYVITDMIHIRELDFPFLWLDSIIFFMAAFTSVCIGIYSLDSIHHSFDRFFDKIVGWIVVITCIIMSGFGVYLGRNIRFNSWDIFTNPKHIILTCLRQINEPHAIKLTITLSMVMLFIYVSFYISKKQFIKDIKANLQ